MNPPRSQSLGNISDQLRQFLEQLAKVVGGNISFGSTLANTDVDNNMDASKAFGTTPAAANTDFTVNHLLKRIPIGFITIGLSQGQILYNSPVTPWTNTTITLRCTGSSVGYAIVII